MGLVKKLSFVKTCFSFGRAFSKGYCLNKGSINFVYMLFLFSIVDELLQLRLLEIVDE